MRRIQHPGPSVDPKWEAVLCRTDSFPAELHPGKSLLDAISGLVESHGSQSAVLRLGGGVLSRFCYYMPDLSSRPEYAVYFSDRHDVEGAVRLESASVTFGLRDGQPWLHCHAIWIEPDGKRRCGHLIPDINWIDRPVHAEVTLLDGAVFTVLPDPETNFSLFLPRNKQSINTDGRHAFAVRLSPNIDVCHAIESICSELQLNDVEIKGGVGSTVGAVFEDGRIVEPFVTEVFIKSGQVIKKQDYGHQALIDVSMVDYTGGLSEGRLERGQNPVLVTFELVLQPKFQE